MSVFANPDEGWSPEGLAAEIQQWREPGASHYFLTVGWADWR